MIRQRGGAQTVKSMATFSLRGTSAQPSPKSRLPIHGRRSIRVPRCRKQQVSMRWTYLRALSQTSTECFYYREDKWYYAGRYVAIPLGDLSAKEWEALDAEVCVTVLP